MQEFKDRSIYYGDLKLGNILIFKDATVKFGDFGISFGIEEGKEY